MPEPTPERPRDAGVAETEPEELGQHEGASLLANEARERLKADGFTEAQIESWAETFIADRGSGTVDDFIAWIAEQEKPA